jgi:hypothetical protein
MSVQENVSPRKLIANEPSDQNGNISQGLNSKILGFNICITEDDERPSQSPENIERYKILVIINK